MMSKSDKTYTEQVGQTVPIIVRIHGPMRSGKSFLKKHIEGMIYENKETFMYNPTIIVLEDGNVEDEIKLKELRKTRYDL